MKFIHPRVEVVEQQPGIEGIKKQIEIAGRTAYKSEGNITEDSYEKFVDMLIQKDHGAALEHGTVYLKIEYQYDFSSIVADKYIQNKYSEVHKIIDEESLDTTWHVTTNYRVIIQNGWLDDLKYQVEPTGYHTRRVAFRITCSRAVGTELIRHRVFSFLQESTRYVNYKEGITCIIPSWCDDIQEGEEFTEDDLDPGKVMKQILQGKRSETALIFASAGVLSEKVYTSMVTELKRKPQEARDALPLGLKTEIVMTGTIPQWEGFLKLRSPEHGAHGVHPDMAVIANQIRDMLIHMNYLKVND